MQDSNQGHALPATVTRDAVLESYLLSRADTPLLLRQALAEQPEDVQLQAFAGYLALLAGTPSHRERARALHAGLAARSELASAADAAHVRALGLWLQDDLQALERELEAQLDRDPHDMLALRLLHHLYFYDGDARSMRDSVAARLPDWKGHRLEPHVLGMLAFGAEEAGDLEQAEQLGRQAVDAEPGNAWAAHAVAHVMEMQGRPHEGQRWLQALRERWRDTNNFRFHLYWHEALFLLADDQMDAVIELYDRDLVPALTDDFYLDLCNASSLLLRLEARGIDVGARWTPLAELAADHVRDQELVFASIHYLLPLLRLRHPAMAALQQNLVAWAGRDTAQGRVMREVGLPLAGFIETALAGDDARKAAAAYAEVEPVLHRIGGSHAQRALFPILRDHCGSDHLAQA